MKQDKRYVVTMDMYVYAENDYMAKKRADDIRRLIDDYDYAANTKVKTIGEQPFGSLDYREMKDVTYYASKKSTNPKLPF